MSGTFGEDYSPKHKKFATPKPWGREAPGRRRAGASRERAMDIVIKNSQLTVRLSSMGGSFTSIRANGREYLWQGDPAVWSGQAPICFPICGGLRDGQATTRAGDKIELARHGFARKQEFELEQCSETSATFVLRGTPELLAQYPFAFELRARYEVVGATLKVTYAVTNAGDKPMPFFVGGHPGFACPLDEGESYEDYELRFSVPETNTVPLPVPATGLIDVALRAAGPQTDTVLPLTHGLFDYAETIYDELNSRAVTLTTRAGDKGVCVSFPEMPYLVVWSKPEGDFVAMEPWGGLSTCSDEDDVFENKRGCLVASPGNTIERGFEATVF